MKLIVDSGSTKADWILFDTNGSFIKTFATLGLNPEVVSIDEVLKRLNISEDLMVLQTKVREIHFYGSGCGTIRSKEMMQVALQKFFTETSIFIIKEDTYAAVYATCKENEKAIVCINGTGSNCSYFDGSEVIQAVDSLGYLAMDDCGGVQFGREMIRSYFFKTMPENLRVKFATSYDLNSDTIKNRFYKTENPNAYLASFLPFLIEHKSESFFKELIESQITFFINNYIKQFENYKEVPIHFVGSVAFLLKENFEEILKQNELTPGKFYQKPLDGLINFYN
ncbi:N-acetylglucosamine kinase [Flavobacterium sp. I3-2]|uniref:N-acetylglucosamine kinase n=1 Tax=Flavobacterium sp. I3-2 TaxID=2748319 RepID=UPI0015AC83EF|nr:N-acetylglucosamine kinase [Flavobacterium sp. I3-2]